MSQHGVPTVDLIPARKLERRKAVEQRQRELETEFEARFPALYKKAQALRPPAPPSAAQESAPSPISPSPPPPFHSGKQWDDQPFRHVDWTTAKKVADDDDDFDLRKAPLVGPLASGLEKMRQAGELARAESRTPPQAQGYHHQRLGEDYPEKGKMAYYADDYEHDYEEIDPKSEGLGNDPGFQKAGSQAGVGAGAKAQDKGGGDGTAGGACGEEAASGKKAAKKKPQHLWERLRSGAGR